MNTFIQKSIKTTLSSLILSIISGLFARELTRSALKTLGYVRFQEAARFLNLGHGHILVVFAVVPLIFALIAFLLKDNAPDAPKGLNTFNMLYHAGAGLAVALMLYKGYGLVFLTAKLDSLASADAALFGGSMMLRMSLYTLAHPLMAVGLIGLCVKFWQVQKATAW